MISVELHKTTFVFETRILVSGSFSDKNFLFFIFYFFFFLPSWIPIEQQFVIDEFIGSLLFLSLLSVLNIVSSSFVVKSYPPFATQFSYLLRRFGWNPVGVSILVSGYCSIFIKSINNITFGKRFISTSLLEVIIKNSHFESFEWLKFIPWKSFLPQ